MTIKFSENSAENLGVFYLRLIYEDMTKILRQKSAKNAEFYACENCNFKCSKKSEFDRHLMTRKHQKLTNTKNDEEIRSEKNAKNTEFYACENCNFKCSKKSEFDRHLMTRKHQKTPKTPKTPKIYKCKCGNEYKHAQSLWNHNKICTIKEENEHYTKADDSSSDDKELIKILVSQNQEMMKIMHDQYTQLANMNANAQPGNVNSHNTNHTNSHNKTFNLQFFLNETCKDAMNITDFVNSLKLTLQDLEQVGELGYAEGISRMFVKGLNDLEVTKRPIHCSDLKREVLHIKDKDVWEKDENKDRLKKAIKDLSNKNFMLMDDWQKENPGCKEYNNHKNDIYLKMMIESLGPADASAEKRDFGKIIRTIAKNTIIDRENL